MSEVTDELTVRDLALKVLASICLCDNMGDVWSDMDSMLRLAKIELPEWADESDLLNILAEMGVTTLQGTTLEVENEEDEEEDD